MIDHLLTPTGPGPRPPADGFARALRGARRRRWRTLRRNAVRGTAAAAVIAVAASPHLTAGGVNGLQPAAPGVRHTYAEQRPAPGASRAVLPSATPAATVAPRDGGYGGSYGAAGSGDGPANVPGRGPGTPPETGAETSPPTTIPAGVHATASPPPDFDVAAPPAAVPNTPEPSPTPSPEPTPPPREPVDQSFEDQSVSAPCEASTWCLAAQVLGSDGDGIRILKLSACRTASDTSGVVHFDVENEADFRIVQGGRVLWQWSDGEPDPAYAHDVTVDRWQCVVWTTPWYVTDQAGYAAAPGTYRLDAMTRASNVSNAWRSASFDVA